MRDFSRTLSAERVKFGEARQPARMRFAVSFDRETFFRIEAQAKREGISAQALVQRHAERLLEPDALKAAQAGAPSAGPMPEARRNQLRSFAADRGIHGMPLVAYMALAEHFWPKTSGPMSASQLAGLATTLVASTASAALARLEGAGLLERHGASKTPAARMCVLTVPGREA